MSDAFADFLPSYWRERRGRRRFWLARGALLLSVVTLLAALGYFDQNARNAVRARVADGERRYQLAVGRIAEVEQLEQKKAQLTERLSALSGVFAHVRGANVVHAVGNACTPSVSLTRLELGYRAESGGGRVMTVSLEGVCPDTREGTVFERLLQADPHLSSARMVRTDPIDAYRPDKSFLITAVASSVDLRGEIEAVEDPQTPDDSGASADEAAGGFRDPEDSAAAPAGEDESVEPGR